MFQIVLIIFILCFSSANFADNWDKQNVQIDVASSHQQLSSAEQYNLSELALNASLTKLIQGIGFRLGAELGHVEPSQPDFTSNTNYRIAVASRVFLSQNINVDLSSKSIQSFSLVSPVNGIYRSVISDYEQTEIENNSIKFNLGSDQSKRSLAFSVSQNESTLYLTDKLNEYSQDSAFQMDARYQNKVTEDTFVVVEYRNRTFEKSFFAGSDDNLTLNRALFGFKTAYLSNSNVEILVGNTNSDEQGINETSNLLSWKATNSINVSDYLTWDIVVARDVKDSNDPRFVSSKTYEFTTNFKYLLSDYTSLGIEVMRKNRHYGESANSEQTQARISLNYRLLEQLTLISSIEVFENVDSREQFSLDGQQWQFGVLWRLI